MGSDMGECAGRSGRAPGAGKSRRQAADEAVTRNSTKIRLPMLGDLTLPSAPHLAWYAGVVALGAAEIIEWPVAAVLALGKFLADNRSNQALHDFGEALEDAG